MLESEFSPLEMICQIGIIGSNVKHNIYSLRFTFHDSKLAGRKRRNIFVKEASDSLPEELL